MTSITIDELHSHFPELSRTIMDSLCSHRLELVSIKKNQKNLKNFLQNIQIWITQLMQYLQNA